MIPGLLVALVPFLVSQAEKLFGSGEGYKKHAWVREAIIGADPLIRRLEPDWAKKSNEEIESLLALAIEFALDKLEA